jgi:DNA polymerase-3 subunit delta
MARSSRLYLLLGPEVGEKDDFVGQLRNGLAKEHGRPPEEHRLYAFDLDLSETMAMLRNGSLFTPHRLVLLNGAEQISRKNDIEQLKSFREHPPDSATLVLLSDQVKIDSKLDKIVPSEGKKIFWEMFENQKQGWVQGQVRRRGGKITSEAASELLEMVENNTRELSLAIERLVIYVGKRKEIGIEDIETFMYHSKEENVFTLFAALARRDLELSLEIAQKMLLSNESQPIQTVAGLLWQYRKLLALARMISDGVHPKEAFTRVNVRGKRNQETYMSAVRSYGIAELERAIALLTDADAELRRSGGALSKTLLDLLLYNLTVKKERIHA